MRRFKLTRANSLLLVICLLTISADCSRDSLTTDTRSVQLSSDLEKVKFLAKYLKLESEIEATEFHIQYRDNSGGIVPAPSDWDIQAVMKVRPVDIGRWTEGMRRVDAPAQSDEHGFAFEDGLDWGYALLPKESRWRINSQPAVFTREGSSVMVAVFEEEGVIMKRVVKY